MRELALGRDFIKAIGPALGIQTDDVTKIVITIVPNDVVRVTVFKIGTDRLLDTNWDKYLDNAEINE